MKKRSFKRSVIAMMMAMVLLVSPMQVFAEEVPTEAVYDMEKGGTQTFVVRNAEGGIDEVTIRELSGNSRVADGEYEVGYNNTGVWIASFVINVSSNKIYNAHSGQYYVYLGSIRYPAISRPSTTQAIYSFIHVRNMVNYITGVDAIISNGNIVVSRYN